MSTAIALTQAGHSVTLYERHPLDGGLQIEGRSGQPVDPRYDHHVADEDVVLSPEQITPVGLRIVDFFPVDASVAVLP
jgi:uncharacterized protein with NAD-binding domain and iron-sulfur cluster